MTLCAPCHPYSIKTATNSFQTLPLYPNERKEESFGDNNLWENEGPLIVVLSHDWIHLSVAASVCGPLSISIPCVAPRGLFSSPSPSSD